MPDNDDLREETIKVVRDIIFEATAEAPADPQEKLASEEKGIAQRRVNAIFGFSTLITAILPAIVSFAPWFDHASRIMFLGFAFIQALIGLVFIDRSTKQDRKLLKSK